jgi:hypothetical protein
MTRRGTKNDAAVGTPAERALARSLTTDPVRHSKDWIDAYVVLEHVAAGEFGAPNVGDPTKLAPGACKRMGLTSKDALHKVRTVMKELLAARVAAHSGGTPVRPMPPLTPSLDSRAKAPASAGDAPNRMMARRCCAHAHCTRGRWRLEASLGVT